MIVKDSNNISLEKSEKAEALINHTISECERLELSIDETLGLPRALEKKIMQHVSANQKSNKFTIANSGGVGGCEKKNKETEYQITKILQWRGPANYLSALSFDDNTKQILVNKDALMRAIQLANPGQHYRDIKLVTNEEYIRIQDKVSDYTSWDEKARKQRETRPI